MTWRGFLAVAATVRDYSIESLLNASSLEYVLLRAGASAVVGLRWRDAETRRAARFVGEAMHSIGQAIVYRLP